MPTNKATPRRANGRGHGIGRGLRVQRKSKPPVRYGRANNRYNGGLCFDKDSGRWRIMCRDGSQMYYYRGVMAAHIGRLLTSREIVHHINDDPSDDRIENLEIKTRRTHIDHHRADLQAARPPLLTHCKRGHPYDEANTYVWHGTRQCRACAALRAKGLHRVGA